MTYSVTRQQLETYKVGPCMISLDADQGFVSVTCSEHDEINGNHYWRARGSDSLKRFLVGLNCEYAMGKLFGHRRLEEWDDDKTKEEIKRHIIECRRDGSLDREEARDLWDDVEAAESEGSIADLSTVNGECWYEWIRHREKPCVEWFWSKVWAPFVQTLRQEIEQGQTAVEVPPVKLPRNQAALYRYRNDVRFHAAVTWMASMGLGPDDAHQVGDALDSLLVPLDHSKVAASTTARLTAAERAAERGAASEVVAPTSGPVA